MNESASITLSVVVPAYNERWRILGTLLELVEYLDERDYAYEIIVVDDGSTDETWELVSRLARLRPQVRLIQLLKNQGKGCAVRTGVLDAQGKYILFTDADGATPPTEIKRLERALAEGADLAIGSRALQSEDTEVSTWIHRKLLGRIFNKVVNFLVVPNIADTQCGFKMFTRPAALFLFRHSQADGFSFDVEVLHIAQRAGLTVREVAVNWTNVPGSKVNLVLDGLKMFFDVIFIALRHRKINKKSFLKFQTQLQQLK